ncbi:hypothetical protein PIB30_101063 [Stylosanthes scabra]|uniref:Putative plant transposon protein domain-containing protein n=1 Tax=Stylosanthes scabra TaxID=79078 RepID=A0ABU6WYF1_9FABA|nr:hypothetical protein [Stylosanthes scabra]
MIKEFFANAARTQEEMDEAEQHHLKSFVRGVEVDFSPANIKRVMKFKDNTLGTETNYNTRQDSNQMLEEVLRDLCIPGATWKLGSGQPPQPIQLRRKELQQLARGWLEFITHNIHPSSNRSEVTVAKAILIHSIIKGEDVRVEELISARIANIAQNLKLKGKLAFPSLIYKLCKEAKVPFGEYKRNACVNEESTITAKVMETVRGGALPILRRHQEEVGHDEDQHHDEDQVMHEAVHDEDQDQVMHEAEYHYDPPEQPQPQQQPQQQPTIVCDFQDFQQQQ